MGIDRAVFLKSCGKQEEIVAESGEKARDLESRAENAKRELERLSKGLQITDSLREHLGEEFGPTYAFVKKCSPGYFELSVNVKLMDDCNVCHNSRPIVAELGQITSGPNKGARAAKIYLLCPEHGARYLSTSVDVDTREKD